MRQNLRINLISSKLKISHVILLFSNLVNLSSNYRLTNFILFYFNDYLLYFAFQMARYSARLNGFERAVMKPQLLTGNQRNGLLRDDTSDITVTSTIDVTSNG